MQCIEECHWYFRIGNQKLKVISYGQLLVGWEP